MENIQVRVVYSSSVSGPYEVFYSVEEFNSKYIFRNSRILSIEIIKKIQSYGSL